MDKAKSKFGKKTETKNKKTFFNKKKVRPPLPLPTINFQFLSQSQSFILDNFDESSTRHLLPILPDIHDREDILRFIKELFILPITAIFHFSIPNCKLEKYRNWYMVTFLMSILWLAVLSYFMIWMVKKIKKKNRTILKCIFLR